MHACIQFCALQIQRLCLHLKDLLINTTIINIDHVFIDQ